MVGLFGLILNGTYRGLIHGEPITLETIKSIASVRMYRLILIALVAAMAFAILDIHALLSKPKEMAAFRDTPNTNPLGFVTVRFRRYLLPVVVLLYVGLVYRLAPGGKPSFVVTNAPAIFVVLFLVARRPLDMSVSDVWKRAVDEFTAFCGGLSGSR